MEAGIDSFTKIQEGLRLGSGGRILIRAAGQKFSIQRTGMASFCLTRDEVEWLHGICKRALTSSEPVVHFQFRTETMGACGRKAPFARRTKVHDEVTCGSCVSTVKFAEEN